MIELTDLPGGDLIIGGLKDLEEHRLTVNALLVLAGAPRLRAAGLDVPEVALSELPEHLLYDALRASEVLDPYRAYNALIRRLVSFESALEQVAAARLTP